MRGDYGKEWIMCTHMEESVHCLSGAIITFLTGYNPIQKKSLIRKKKKGLQKIFLCRTRYYQSYQVAGLGQEETRNFWVRAYKRFQRSRNWFGKVAQQRPLTRSRTVITAGQESPESLRRGSGLMLWPAWHLLPVRPFLSMQLPENPWVHTNLSYSDRIPLAIIQEAW